MNKASKEKKETRVSELDVIFKKKTFLKGKWKQDEETKNDVRVKTVQQETTKNQNQKRKNVCVCVLVISGKQQQDINQHMQK